MPDAKHDGISMSNFTAGKRRENSSVAFGKEDAGNDFWGMPFSHDLMPIKAAKRQASSINGEGLCKR